MALNTDVPTLTGAIMKVPTLFSVLAIVAIIGLAGWFSYHKADQLNQALKAQAQPVIVVEHPKTVDPTLPKEGDNLIIIGKLNGIPLGVDTDSFQTHDGKTAFFLVGILPDDGDGITNAVQRVLIDCHKHKTMFVDVRAVDAKANVLASKQYPPEWLPDTSPLLIAVETVVCGGPPPGTHKHHASEMI